MFEMLVLIRGDKSRKKTVFYCDYSVALSTLTVYVADFRLYHLIKIYANKRKVNFYILPRRNGDPQ